MSSASTGPLSILCIEDDQDARTIIELALRLDPAIDVRAVGSAAETMTLWSTGYRPDLIILDVRMPELGGIALLQQLRSNDTVSPFIFLTGVVREHELEDLRSVGPIGIIAKPFDPLRLSSAVRALLWDNLQDCSRA